MKTVIYGNGAMARVFYSYVRHARDVAGFTVDDHLCAEARFCGLPLVPFSLVETVFVPADHLLITAVGFVEMNRLRARKYMEGRAKGFAFDRYVHPSVVAHDDVTIEENAIVLDHVSIHPGSRIGRGAFLSSNVNIGHDCAIGDEAWINAGVSIAGGVTVGSGSFFGVNASVGQGVRIGRRNFIAANALINRDTRDDQVYLAAAGELFRLDSQAFLKFSRLTD